MKEIIIVAYLNLHDGKLNQMLVPEVSGLAAMNKYLETDFQTEEEVYQYCANTDSYISYLEL